MLLRLCLNRRSRLRKFARFHLVSFGQNDAVANSSLIQHCHHLAVDIL